MRFAPRDAAKLLQCFWYPKWQSFVGSRLGGEWRPYASSQLRCERQGHLGKSILTSVSTRKSFCESPPPPVDFTCPSSPPPTPPINSTFLSLQWIPWILPDNCPHPQLKDYPPFYPLSPSIVTSVWVTLGSLWSWARPCSPLLWLEVSTFTQRYFNSAPASPWGKWRPRWPGGTSLPNEKYHGHVSVVFQQQHTLCWTQYVIISLKSITISVIGESLSISGCAVYQTSESWTFIRQRGKNTSACTIPLLSSLAFSPSC